MALKIGMCSCLLSSAATIACLCIAVYLIVQVTLDVDWYRSNAQRVFALQLSPRQDLLLTPGQLPAALTSLATSWARCLPDVYLLGVAKGGTSVSTACTILSYSIPAKPEAPPPVHRAYSSTCCNTLASTARTLQKRLTTSSDGPSCALPLSQP